MRNIVKGTLEDLIPTESGLALAKTDEPLTDAHFREPSCRNCGEPCTTKFCGNCGQGMAQRFSFEDVKKELWERHRLFDLGWLNTVTRLLVRPGVVAREYVLGARKRYMHPLNLLLVAIGFLVLILGQTNYLTAGQQTLSPLMEKVAAWSQWSFSLGLFAIWLSGVIIFWRRLSYNLIEQAIMAAYTQIAIIMVNLLNLLPLMLITTPSAIVTHRSISSLYMSWIELAFVALAFYQFYRIKLRQEWWRLGLALGSYYLLKRVFVQAYAYLVVYIVTGVWPKL